LRAVSGVRLRVKAKFHYAILVADRFEAGTGPKLVADLIAHASSLLAG